MMREKWSYAVAVLIGSILVSFGFGMAGGIFGAGLVRQTSAERLQVRSQNFLVQGKFGPCAAFGLNDAGDKVYIETADQTERPRLKGGAEEGNPRIGLCDKNGVLRVLLGMGADGIPRLDLRDQDGKCRAALVVGPDGKPLLTLHDKDGKVVWQAP